MTDSSPDRSRTVLDYAEPPTPERWTVSSALGVLGSAVVLAGVLLLVIHLLAYLLA